MKKIVISIKSEKDIEEQLVTQGENENSRSISTREKIQ